MDRLTELEKIFNDFNMIGQDGITVHGDLHRGYAVHNMFGGDAPSGAIGFPSFPPPPPIVISTGACCVGSDCSIETEDDCDDMGGIYQGDDTECDPNPCQISPCCGSIFQAFDGSCRFFLTKTTVFTATYDNSGVPFHRTGSASVTTIETYNPVTCAYSCSRTGTNTSDEFDTRNNCQTLQCFTDTSQICGRWTDHRIAKDSHGGGGCTLVFDSYFTFFDSTDACGNINISSTCCPQVNSGSPSCFSSATVETASDLNSLGSYSNVATLSDEVNCPTGACCDFNTETCRITTECDCNGGFEFYLGDDTLCDACGF